jgi:hypothetical protein
LGPLLFGILSPCPALVLLLLVSGFFGSPDFLLFSPGFPFWDSCPGSPGCDSLPGSPFSDSAASGDFGSFAFSSAGFLSASSCGLRGSSCFAASGRFSFFAFESAAPPFSFFCSSEFASSADGFLSVFVGLFACRLSRCGRLHFLSRLQVVLAIPCRLASFLVLLSGAVFP